MNPPARRVLQQRPWEDWITRDRAEIARLSAEIAKAEAQIDSIVYGGRVSEVVEIVWRRNLRVNQHPPNRRRQPPGRSRHEAEYR